MTSLFKFYQILGFLQPPVTAPTRFHANQVRTDLSEECQHLAIPQLLAQDQLFLLVHSMDLKNILGQIDVNAHNLYPSSPFSCDWWLTAAIWHILCRIGRGMPYHFHKMHKMLAYLCTF